MKASRASMQAQNVVVEAVERKRLKIPCRARGSQNRRKVIAKNILKIKGREIRLDHRRRRRWSRRRERKNERKKKKEKGKKGEEREWEGDLAEEKRGDF